MTKYFRSQPQSSALNQYNIPPKNPKTNPQRENEEYFFQSYLKTLEQKIHDTKIETDDVQNFIRNEIFDSFHHFQNGLETLDSSALKLRINSLTGFLVTCLLLYQTTLTDKNFLNEIANKAVDSAMQSYPEVANKLASASVGYVVAGVPGAIAATIISGSQIAEAKKPATSLNKPSSKTLREASSPSQIASLRELRMPESKVFVVTKNGGDFILTAKGLNYFHEIACTKGEIDLKKLQQYHFVLLKNEALQEVVKNNDFPKFKTLIASSVKNLKRHYRASENFFPSIVSLIGSKLQKGKYSTQLELLEDLTDEIGAAVEIKKSERQQLKQIILDVGMESRSKGYELATSGFYNILKERSEQFIFRRFKDDSFLEEQFQNLRKNFKEKGQNHKNLLEVFRISEDAGIKIERYNDRLEKFANLVKDDFSQIIIYEDDMYKNNLGFNFSPQVSTIFVSPDISKTNTTLLHEASHNGDIRNCIIDEQGKMKIRTTEIFPCGSDQITGQNFYNKIKSSYQKDLSLIKKLKDWNDGLFRQKIEGLKSLIDNEEREVFAYCTDLFNPESFLRLFPNVAVTRTFAIEKNSDEAKFYSAILQADFDFVKREIKNNPSILEKEYDGIALHKISQMIWKNNYDNSVDPELKKSKSSYKEIDDYVQSKHNQNMRQKPRSSRTEL